jgi:hypothetical protein
MIGGMLDGMIGGMIGGMIWKAPSSKTRLRDKLVADGPSTSSPMVLEAKVISVSSPDLD